MNPYVIPGLEEKRSYVEQCNVQNKIVKPAVPEEVLREVYRVVCDYFNVSLDIPFNSRKKEIIVVRHWTIFVAKCKGLSNSETASFFNRNTSMSQYIINKMMAEIKIYEKAREAFDFFIISLGLMMDHKNLKGNKLKTWLKDYYTKMQRQIRLLAHQPADFDEEQHKADMRTFLDKIHENRVSIYSQYTSIGRKIDENKKLPC